MHSPRSDSEGEEEDYAENRPSFAVAGAHHNNSGVSSSMYSRIFDDIRFKIPNVDFHSLEESDDEEEKIVTTHVSATQTQSVFQEYQEDPRSSAESSSPSLEAVESECQEMASGGRSPRCTTAVACEYKETASIGTSPQVMSAVSCAGTSTDESDFDAASTSGHELSSHEPERSVSCSTSTRQNMGISTQTENKSSQLRISRRNGTLSLHLEADIEHETLDEELHRLNKLVQDTPVKQPPQHLVEENKLALKKSKDEADAELVLKLSSHSLNEKNSTSRVDELLGRISAQSLKVKTSDVETSAEVEEQECSETSSHGKTANVLSSASHEQQKDIQPSTVCLDLRNEIQDLAIKNLKVNVFHRAVEDDRCSSSDEEDWNEMRKDLKKNSRTKISSNAQTMLQAGKFESSPGNELTSSKKDPSWFNGSKEDSGDIGIPTIHNLDILSTNEHLDKQTANERLEKQPINEHLYKQSTNEHRDKQSTNEHLGQQAANEHQENQSANEHQEKQATYVHPDRQLTNYESRFNKRYHMVDNGNNNGGSFDISPLADKIRSWHAFEKRNQENTLTQCNENAKHNNNLLSDEQFDTETHSHHTSDIDRDFSGNYSRENNIKEVRENKEQLTLQTHITDASRKLDGIDNNSASKETSPRKQPFSTTTENGALPNSRNVKRNKEFSTSDSSLLKLETTHSNKSECTETKDSSQVKDDEITNASDRKSIPSRTATNYSNNNGSSSSNGLSENILIADNLMLIKADISGSGDYASGPYNNSIHWRNDEISPGHEDIELNAESQGQRTHGCSSSKTGLSSTGGRVDFDEGQTTNNWSNVKGDSDHTKERVITPNEIELTTFSSKDSKATKPLQQERVRHIDDQESSLKGLLPQLKTNSPCNLSNVDALKQGKTAVQSLRTDSTKVKTIANENRNDLSKETRSGLSNKKVNEHLTESKSTSSKENKKGMDSMKEMKSVLLKEKLIELSKNKSNPQGSSQKFLDDLLQTKGVEVAKMIRVDPSNDVICLQSGEETPLVTNQQKSKLTGEKSDLKYTNRKGKSFGKEDIQIADQNENVIVRNNESLLKSADNGNTSSKSSKSKKKSKRKGNKATDDSPNARKSSDCQVSAKDTQSLKKSNSTDIEDGKKRVKGITLRENERLKVKEQIVLLQREYGAANIVFDEEHSFSQAFASLPQLPKETGKLLLQISLQSPGVCSKACAKNTLSLEERSDAYIGLCTFFLSILHGSKFSICEYLKIPFCVIAFEQAYIDSELHLFIGIIENEISEQPSHVWKRGKPQKSKKSFHQTVTQYLNKTSLEEILAQLMVFDVEESYGMSRHVSCPGSRKLSSFVAVSQDVAAVDRIFGLKPSLLWNKIAVSSEQLSGRTTWIPDKGSRNENTTVLIDHLTSLLPRTLCEFFKMTREASLDICGHRVAYVPNAAGTETVFLVAALRGPNVTTVQVGQTFTSETPGLSSIKSIFSRTDFVSTLKPPRSISVNGPSGVNTFLVTIENPLLTYIIGRRRGESEVVRWFGRRVNSVSDIDISLPEENKHMTSKSKAQDKNEVLSKGAPTSSLLTLCSDKIMLAISSLVPSVYIQAAIKMAETRGLHAVSIGKTLLCEDDLVTVGLKICSDDPDLPADRNKKKQSKYSVSLIVFQGENCAFRSMGLLSSLYKHLDRKLPRDAMTKETLQQKWNGLIKFDRVRQQRSIDDFFAVCPISKKITQILDHMTLPRFSHIDNEILNALPPLRVDTADMPHIQVAILIGQPMVEIISHVLNLMFSECVEDPLCKDASSVRNSPFLCQERPTAEIIGIKQFSSIPKHMAHVCNQHAIGSRPWLSCIRNLENGPLVVLVIRNVQMSVEISQHCETIKKHVAKKLQANELKCSSDSYYDAYAFRDMDTVLRIMLSMFHIDELLPDACSTWYKHTQWPVYLPRNRLPSGLDSILSLFSNANEQRTFNETKRLNAADRFQVLSPLSLSVPASLILKSQKSLSFIKIQVDWNYPKYIAKILGNLSRDQFKIVGLNFPGGISPSFDSSPKMHVAVSRPNAVFRLNQWIEELTHDLYNKHIVEVSPTAKRAYEEIAWHFQRTETGGVFEDSPLTNAEKLKFREDDIYASKAFRRVEWSLQAVENNLTGPKNSGSSPSKKGQKVNLNEDCFVMPEVTVIVVTNVFLRGIFLGEKLPENVKYLGFWEKLSTLGFKTIGARMTALKEEHAEYLLAKFEMSGQQKSSMVKRISSSNGPVFVLALLRDFALSNFWNILSRSMTEKEVSLVKDNVLVPDNRSQVEILLGSLFESVVPNSEVEIKKIK